MVDWLVQHDYAKTRADAVSIGNSMLAQGIIRNTKGNTPMSLSNYATLAVVTNSKAKRVSMMTQIRVTNSLNQGYVVYKQSCNADLMFRQTKLSQAWHLDHK